jgi:DNA-binding NtrC family response regulator
LRDRPEDLLPLAEAFLRKFVLESGCAPKTLSKEAVRFILENQWRGNVRELENSLERAVALSSGPAILLEHFLPMTGLKAKARLQEGTENMFCMPFATDLPQLEEVIQKYIEFAIEKNLGARDKTAKEIGIDRKTLYKRINPKEVTNGKSHI